MSEIMVIAHQPSSQHTSQQSRCGKRRIPYEIEYGVVMDQLSRIYKSWKSTILEYIANAESACMSTLNLNIQ